MDYFKKILRSLSGSKKSGEPLPTRQEMFGDLATRFTAGYAYGLIESLPDPDPVLRKLGKTVEVYDEIRADAKVNACIEQRKAGTSSLEWGLNADTNNEKAAEIIEQALKALDMPRIVSECLDAVLYGFQPLEVLWEHRDGLILPRDVLGKPSHWFLFDAENRLRFKAAGYLDGIELPQRKFILVQHQASYINPYGVKLLSQCFWPVTFKKSGWRWWVTATEKYGMPFILGKVPRGTDDSEQADLLKKLDDLIQDAVAVLPNDSQVEILQGSGSGAQGDSRHKELIDQCNNEIALALLGQTLTSEIGSTGSYAASKTHNEVRGDIAAADKRMVERALQTLVDWIYAINWGQGAAPAFAMWHDVDVDKDLAERDKILTETGIKFSKSYYLRAYGLEDEDFELSEPAPGAEFAEASLKKPAKDVKGALNKVDRFLDIEQGAQLIRPCLDLLAECSDYEQVLQKLFDLYPDIDTSLLVEGLTRAMYLAELEGSSHVKRSPKRR